MKVEKSLSLWADGVIKSEALRSRKMAQGSSCVVSDLDTAVKHLIYTKKVSITAKSVQNRKRGALLIKNLEMIASPIKFSALGCSSRIDMKPPRNSGIAFS
jgi:hypothetical protein